MDTTEKFEEINQHRRGFLGTAVVTVAAAQLLLNGKRFRAVRARPLRPSRRRS